MSEYEYAVTVYADEDITRPKALWRRATPDGDWEFLSLNDWQWHPRGEFELRAPTRLHPVSPSLAAELHSDRQRFARYWFNLLAVAPGVTEQLPEVLRRRNSPEMLIDEVFDRRGRWLPSGKIETFESGRSAEPDLRATEADAAELFLRERLGVEGATVL